MTTILSRHKGQVHDADALPLGDKQRQSAAERNSHDLKLAIRGAIARQARLWGIRPDQAQALLLDHRSIA
jgi:hypothetical protein